MLKIRRIKRIFELKFDLGSDLAQLKGYKRDALDQYYNNLKTKPNRN